MTRKSVYRMICKHMRRIDVSRPLPHDLAGLEERMPEIAAIVRNCDERGREHFFRSLGIAEAVMLYEKSDALCAGVDLGEPLCREIFLANFETCLARDLVDQPGT